MKENKKVAIVTGGASGIGAAIVDVLSIDGYQVNILDKQVPLRTIKRTRVNYHHIDLKSKSVIKLVVKELLDRYDHISVLINCAGVYPSVHLEKYTDELWQECFAVNIFAPFWLTQAVVPSMKKYGWGRIINITSGAVYLGSRDPGYSASKSALNGLTKSLQEFSQI